MGWRIEVPDGCLKWSKINYFVFAIDRFFPYSQPRVLAPAAGSQYLWPHVEPHGLLCLRPTKCNASVSDRVQVHLSDAEDLFRYSEDERLDEFRREFLTYWSRRATDQSSSERVLSLVSPRMGNREISYFYDAKSKRFVIGDDKASLEHWLRNAGLNPRSKEILPTWIIPLDHPWEPKDFPEKGRDVIGILPNSLEIFRHSLVAGLERLPILFEVDTGAGSVFAGVVLHGMSRRELLKGFRHLNLVPTERIACAYKHNAIERVRVSRVDGAWVHGRDHPSSFDSVKGRKLAIVGCGSIGSGVARLLAQAGVGEIIFIDGDSLSSANISRHSLGMEHVGSNKATLLQSEFRKQFPHLTFDHAIPRRFEFLSGKYLEYLEEVDLVIAAGIDFEGEAALNKWRLSLSQPPAYLSTWAEAYATAGHAVLLYGNQSILDLFDNEERPIFRLTDWDDSSGSMIIEAGCGNSFQPHGVIDLQPTITLAAGLALDTLLDQVPASCRRVWMGNPSNVQQHGGILRDTFTETMMVREFTWP